MSQPSYGNTAAPDFFFRRSVTVLVAQVSPACAWLQSGCIAVVDGYLAPTQRGRVYLDYLQRHAAPGV